MVHSTPKTNNVIKPSESWAVAGSFESIEAYRSLIDLVAQAVWETNANGQVVADSPSWRAYTGQTEAEWLGEGWVNAVHPDQQSYALQNWREAIRTHTWVNAEFRLRNPAGGWRWTNVRAAPVLDANGEVSKWVGMNIDISENRRTGETLRESKANYQTLFEKIDEGCFLCEILYDETNAPIDILYLSANPAAARMVGQDFTGRRLREIDASYEDYWYEIFYRVARTGQSERMEQYAESDKKWYDFSVFKVSDRGSRIAVVFQDVTGRKRQQASAAFLIDIQNNFTNLSSTDEIMQTIGARIGEYMQVKTCNFLGVDLTQPEEITVSYGWALDGYPDLQHQKFRIQDFISGGEFHRVSRQGETMVVCDTRTDPRTDGEACARLRVGAFVSVPFANSGESNYLFSVSDGQPRAWRDDEISLFEKLANLIFPRLEQARTQEALRRSEERMRIAIEAAEMGTWEWNLPDNEVYWNEQHFLLFGMQPHQRAVTPDEFMRHVHPDDIDRIKAKLTYAIQGKTIYKAEFKVVHEDGTVRWMSGYGRVTAEEDDKATRLNGVIFDIDDRIEADEALRQSEEQQRIVMASITDHALITTDTHNVVTSWNVGAQKLFGYTAEEAIGQSAAFIYTPEDRAAGVPEKEAQTAQQQGQAADERYQVRKDGSRFFVSGVQSPLYDMQQRLLGYVTVARDLTQRQQMEEELREADRRKDEFLALLAHELRNPLAPIRNVLQLLKLTSGGDETIGPALAMMSRQVDHLVRLIDDLLDVSRISRGKLELRRERLDLTALVQQATDVMRPLYDSYRRQLEVNLPDFPIYLYGDATRLTQVVTNLLTNGARYTHLEGHVWLSLEIEVTDTLPGLADGPPMGVAAVLRLGDNGIGLAADQLERIFDLFVQVDSSLDRAQGGLGLGLTLVKQLVELHGGRVEARSAGLGRGSEFIVTLPTLLKPTKSMNQVSELASAIGLRQRILVVDDNRDAADTLAMLLKLKKHEVHVRYSGREAIEAAETLKPEIVLLDISMPELDGYQTAMLIRQQPWGSSLVLIALTGYGQEEDRRRSFEAGFDGHLVKPVDLATLLQLMSSLRSVRG
ncbi:PAS domain S-box protein [uncultured Fibrella sp.]|uniref:PAS domain S-box protein n=1 Tax=uncultured Fibrella sp. TaxID=1284596 RepID=UPI0035C986AD